MTLTGTSFIASERGSLHQPLFRALNPLTGEELEPAYSPVSGEETEVAVGAAAEAFPLFAATTAHTRATLLKTIAAKIDALAEEIACRAHLETALPMPRLRGEVARTTGQLRLFAGVLEEGSWLDARIDTAQPDRQPAPRADLRSMLRPIGPVVVFGASNFPVAFSAAGGDTAAALAAGCPVIVKAHSAHPGTSELVATAIHQALAECSLPAGIYSLLYGAGSSTGATLVRHPKVRAVTFTGSLRAGRAIMDMAAARPEPIPCFMEMSSGNPFYLLPSALANPVEMADGLFQSFTLGAGQFCTKPGIVFVTQSAAYEIFLKRLVERVAEAKPFTLLTRGISGDYEKFSAHRATQSRLAAEAPLASEQPAAPARARLFTTTLDEFLAQPELAEEIFGPDTLLVLCSSPEEYRRSVPALAGQLTATVWGDTEELTRHAALLTALSDKAGRVLLNNYPTGVEVVSSMVHGGPYPATSDSRFTSVGTQAIYRFVRPVCYQNYPAHLLPVELQNSNPLAIERLVDGKLSRDAILD